MPSPLLLGQSHQYRVPHIYSADFRNIGQNNLTMTFSPVNKLSPLAWKGCLMSVAWKSSRVSDSRTFPAEATRAADDLLHGLYHPCTLSSQVSHVCRQPISVLGG